MKFQFNPIVCHVIRRWATYGLRILVTVVIMFHLDRVLQNSGMAHTGWGVSRGEILIAVPTFMLMIVTIIRTHEDAINSKMISLKEDQIERLSFETDPIKNMKKMALYKEVSKDSMIIEILYSSRTSPYYQIKPFSVTVEKSDAEGKTTKERLRIRNMHQFFERKTCFGYLMETEMSRSLQYFKGLRRLQVKESYHIVIDYIYKSLFPMNYIVWKSHDTFFVRERIRISPRKDDTDAASKGDRKCVFGVECSVDYFYREKATIRQ